MKAPDAIKKVLRAGNAVRKGRLRRPMQALRGSTTPGQKDIGKVWKSGSAENATMKVPAVTKRALRNGKGVGEARRLQKVNRLRREKQDLHCHRRKAVSRLNQGRGPGGAWPLSMPETR